MSNWIERDRSLRKYNISRNRFRELYYFALQYPEWKDELKYKYDTQKSTTITDMPVAHNGDGRPTEDVAIKCSELSHKITLIESAARLTDPALYKYILKAVTNENVTYDYLKIHMDIPCGKNIFYDRRRRFYWILSQNLEKKGVDIDD